MELAANNQDFGQIFALQYSINADRANKDEHALPLALTAPGAACSIHQLHAHWDQIQAWLDQHGALLLRGYSVKSPLEFKKFAAGFGFALKDYAYASTPRSKVVGGVYSSTEYPPHQSIPLHNEQAYTKAWPEYLWFHCMQASSSGGETPLADSRKVFSQVDEAVRERFQRHGLMYVRNYGTGLDLDWRQVFNTEERRAVEAYCDAHAIEWQWLTSEHLRTRERCQAVVQHPRTAAWVWFNQAHLFHESALPDEIRSSLVDSVGRENLPRNVYFGDGSVIPDQDLDHVRSVLQQCSRGFPWQAGDVLMVDNLLAAHAREPFSGARKVIVAMA